MKKAASFIDKEKQVLITVGQKIGSTLGQVAALGQVAKKASRATIKPVRRRRRRIVRTKFAAKTKRRVRRNGRSKMPSGRRR